MKKCHPKITLIKRIHYRNNSFQFKGKITNQNSIYKQPTQRMGEPSSARCDSPTREVLEITDKRCQLCRNNENKLTLVGCKSEQNETQCGYWIHLECIGFYLKSKMAIENFTFICPRHNNKTIY